MLALAGLCDHRLERELRRQVGSVVAPGPGGLLGLELEFSVRSGQGGRLHFGSLIHRLPVDGYALDPGDPNAYRCSWGGIITSDGAEAEIATPPVRTRPGFTGELEAWARTGEAALRRVLPGGIELDGYSAHLSSAMPARLNDAVCWLYASTFAADLMLLMERADSPGLLVRPRPGRTELCGEFIDGASLSAAAAFAAGTTRACAAAVRSRSVRALLPPSLDVRVARAVHRYGWYVDRGAFGADLHAASRRTLLPRVSGGTISAQSHLELAWAAARQALAEDVAAPDLQAAEAMVTGELPLPAEHRPPRRFLRHQSGEDAPLPRGDTSLILSRSPASRPRTYIRPGFTLRPVAGTWDFTVFEVSGPARRVYACIPRDSLPGFVGQLEEGALDDLITTYLALTSGHRILRAHRQTGHPGLYDRMDAPAALLAPERDPQTGRREPGRWAAKHGVARPGKRNGHEHAPRRPASRSIRGAGRIIAATAAAAVIAAAIIMASVSLASSRLGNRHVHPTPTVGSAATSPRSSTSGGSASASAATGSNISVSAASASSVAGSGTSASSDTGSSTSASGVTGSSTSASSTSTTPQSGQLQIFGVVTPYPPFEPGGTFDFDIGLSGDVPRSARLMLAPANGGPSMDIEQVTYPPLMYRGITLPSTLTPGNYELFLVAGDVTSNSATITVAPPVPILKSIIPSSVTPGDDVTLTGVNFGTPGSILLAFGPGNSGASIKASEWSDNSIVFQVPNLPSGTYDLQIVAAGGVQNQYYGSGGLYIGSAPTGSSTP
jgi:IPT/TIG domain